MERKNNRAFIALAAVCLIWGTTYLALRVAVDDFPPLLFTAIRQTIAGALLIGFMLLTSRSSWPSKAIIVRQAIAGFFMITLGNGLVAWGEVHVPSGVAAIICSLMPAVVVVINLLVSTNEKPTVPIFLGLALGLIGIILIFGQNFADFSNTDYVAGIVAIFLAVISWAAGSVWIKRKHVQSNLFVNAGLQMFFGGIWCFPLSLIFEDLRAITFTADTVWALLYLIIFGSIVAYVSYSFALRRLPMTIVSLYAYVNPLVAVLLGWFLLDELLNVQVALAFVLTVAGIYVVNRGYQLREEWKAQLR